MHVDPLSLLTLATALGSALVGGALFAFSAFVMDALAELPSSQGIAAMQSINVTALRRSFMAAFFGTAVGCVFVGASSLWRWDSPHAIYGLVGSASYLVGTIGVTMAYNVPRNVALMKIDANADDSVRPWTAFVRGWTAWNHVRTLAALVAAAFLVVSLCGGAR